MEVRTAGDRTRRRRLNKLSCAGWIPHDRGSVSGLPHSKGERRSQDRLITGREDSPPWSCRRRCAPAVCLWLSTSWVAVGGSGGCGRCSASVSRGRSRVVYRWRAAPRDRVQRWLAASPPVSTHQDWPADSRARHGIGPGGRLMPRPPLPSAGAAAGCAAPAALMRRSCPGEAGHAVAPGVQLG